uniref:Uncharacterized protein n=1 Tax=Tetranychus urticae TaxID=32264 RepID=T1KB98_TETUR
MIRLVEYNLTIKQNQQRHPLSPTIIVRQFVLLCCYLSLVRYAVHGETNESISSIITEQQPTTNSYTLAEFNKTSSTSLDLTSDSSNNSGTFDVNGINELTKPIEATSVSYYQQSSVESDHVNTQPTVDVPSIVRSDYNQQLDYNSSSISKKPTVMGSPAMGPFNSSLSPLHAANSTLNATNLSNNQSTICDRYTFDHQQVAKFFLTTMILLGFCCLLIIIVLILVAYIYRKLSKGRNVKVWFNK